MKRSTYFKCLYYDELKVRLGGLTNTALLINQKTILIKTHDIL